MISVVDAQRDILLSPAGTNVWSGQVPQSLNSAAVTWSLAKELYGFNGPYWIVPLSLIIGMVPTTISVVNKQGCGLPFALLVRMVDRPENSVGPKIGPVKVSDIMLPLIYQVSLLF